MLVSRDGYPDWARNTYNACKEKHPEASNYIYYDEIAPSVDVVNAREERSEQLVDICTREDMDPPKLPNNPDMEAKKAYMLDVKIYNTRHDEIIKYRNLVTSCIAFIKGTINAEILQLIYSKNNDAREAEVTYNIYEWWMAIGNALIPDGSERMMLGAKYCMELNTFKQGEKENIKEYSIKYMKKREEYRSLGYDTYIHPDLEGVLFIQSLNSQYNDLKNAIQNGIVQVDNFVNMKDRALKWTVKEYNNEVALISTASTASNQVDMNDINVDKKKIEEEIIIKSANENENIEIAAYARVENKKCYLCEGNHLMAQCLYLKEIKDKIKQQKKGNIGRNNNNSYVGKNNHKKKDP